jgi:hypothetical protein
MGTMVFRMREGRPAAFRMRELTEAQVLQFGEQQMFDFDEQKHPRADDGKFASKPGGGKKKPAAAGKAALHDAGQGRKVTVPPRDESDADPKVGKGTKGYREAMHPEKLPAKDQRPADWDDAGVDDYFESLPRDGYKVEVRKDGITVTEPGKPANGSKAVLHEFKSARGFEKWASGL